MKSLNDSNTILKKNQFPVNLFLILSGISFVCLIILSALSEGDALNDVLFGKDYFNDFYNSMCDAGSRDVYTETGVIYPPLSSLFFYLISKMVPHRYIVLEKEQRDIIYTNGVCQLVLLLFIVVSILALGMLLYDVLQRSTPKLGAFLTAFSLTMSFPMLYCIQRGNTIMLALFLCGVFVFYRNSENKVIRELSYIALALAAGFKIFPALFGLLLIFDKKYKEAARLVIYGILAFFVPFAFYGGFDIFIEFLKNLFSFSSKASSYSVQGTSVTNLLTWLSLGFKLDFGIFLTLAKIAVWFGCAFIIFFSNEEWKKLIGIAFVFANVDSTARVYILIFLLLPFVSFIQSHPKGKKNVVYAILFCSLLITIPCAWYFYVDSIAEAFNSALGLDIVKSDWFNKINVLSEPFIVFLFEIILTVDTALALKGRKKKTIE